MIEICRTDGEISIKGHAGYAEPGQDIVCAAVSAITQVFVASVEELTEDEIEADIEAGNASIKYGFLTERAQVLLEAFFLGLEMIAVCIILRMIMSFRENHCFRIIGEK